MWISSTFLVVLIVSYIYFCGPAGLVEVVGVQEVSWVEEGEVGE